MIYKFKDYPQKAGLDAQSIGEELERIRLDNHGQLATEIVLQNASDADSPLYPVFTWDDTTAAHKWRLSEAQKLIRCIVAVDAEKGTENKAFFHVRIVQPDSGKGESYYQSAAVIARNPDEYASALRNVLSDLAGVEGSLEQLRQLAPKASRMPIKTATAHVAEAQKTLAVTTV